MSDLSKMIDKQVEGIANALKMPDVITTSLEKEQKKLKKRKKFRTRLFVIIDDISASEYSEFIDEIIQNKNMEIIREVENWTKDGELIRVVDYVETIVDKKSK